MPNLDSPVTSRVCISQSRIPPLYKCKHLRNNACFNLFPDPDPHRDSFMHHKKWHQFSQKNSVYFQGFENFNGGKIVSKYLVVKASLTNTLHIKSDITFSIFVQRKIGCIRKVMQNLQCSMKPVTLPCAQAPHHCLAAQQPPPIPLFHTLKSLLVCSHDCRTAFVFKAVFLLVQLRSAVEAGLCQLRLPSQQPHSGHRQEHQRKTRHRDHFLVHMEQILRVVGTPGGWIGV